MAGKGTKKQVPATGPKKWFLPICIVIICISTLSLYHNSVKNDFLDLDDMTIIVRNYNFLKDFSNAGQVFKQGAFQVQGEKDTLTSYYRPVMILSFMTDAHISPQKSGYPVPGPFIKANIFYHTLACILLLFLMLELKIPPLPSILLSLIFTVHPLLNQAVAWIPGRNDSLLAIFILSSFIFLLRYLKTKKTSLLIFHILLFLIALFTKENALMLVPISFFFLRFVNKERLPFKTFITIGIGYLVCIIPWLIMRHMALATNTDRSTLNGIATTIVSNLPFYIQYFSKAILPFNLSVMSTNTDTNYVIGLLAIGLLVTGLVLSKKKKKPLVLFGLCWFLLFLTPSFFSSFSGLEHRAYLPLVGVFITVSQFDIFKTAGFRNTSLTGKIGFVCLSGIILVFTIISFNRLPIFHDRFAFDQNAMETSPHSIIPCIYLAAHYEELTQFDKAIDAYREALKRDSTYEIAHNNIAGDYIRMNMFPEAENELKTELRLHPKDYVAVFDLGLVVFQGDHKDSLGAALWKKSIFMDSGFAQPYKVLSQYYQSLGDSTNTILYRNLYIKKSNQ